jgi:DNA polymerase III subunit epsilon
MRHICLDTETTGLSPDYGDRLVEIACVELVNLLPSGRVYHQYINPERDVPQAAFDVHGLNYNFLKDFPVFSKIADDFLHFIEDAPLVIHNAAFDLKFLNAELGKLQKAPLPKDRHINASAEEISRIAGFTGRFM